MDRRAGTRHCPYINGRAGTRHCPYINGWAGTGALPLHQRVGRHGGTAPTSMDRPYNRSIYDTRPLTLKTLPPRNRLGRTQPGDILQQSTSPRCAHWRIVGSLGIQRDGKHCCRRPTRRTKPRRPRRNLWCRPTRTARYPALRHRIPIAYQTP